MKVFLTSSPMGEYLKESDEYPCKLNEKNKFVERLKGAWKENSYVLLICAFPDCYDMNDGMKQSFRDSFEDASLTISHIEACDFRNDDKIGEYMEKADVVILGGGHVPTENAFFRKMSIKERLQNFDGIVMGISAGSMNSAEIVYAQPEMEGESTDPNYEKFIGGLGLVKTMIVPHYQVTKTFMLDGKRLFEDITYADSMGREFYALVDGSYVYAENGKELLCGEAYLIKDGELKKISDVGDEIVLV